MAGSGAGVAAGADRISAAPFDEPELAIQVPPIVKSVPLAEPPMNHAKSRFPVSVTSSQ
jgi:hypothetical protein